MDHGLLDDLTPPLVGGRETRRTGLRLLARGAFGGMAAMVGGLMWALYGVFEMLQPWGEDTVYRDDLAYEIVIDEPLYRLYSMPGGWALLLTAGALLGLTALSAGRAGRVGRGLACAALVLALLSIVGVVISFDPLFTAPRIVGTMALGAGALVAGIEARRSGATGSWPAALVALGLLGLLLLPLWPLVHAIEIVPKAAGAGIIALFGLSWALIGCRLRLEPRVAHGSCERSVRAFREGAR